MESIRAVIIDDEDHCRSTLSKQLEWFCPEVEIVAEGVTVETGLKMIRAHNPDVIFLDIEMPDGTGFDLIRNLDQENLKVIFTTAFDEYAVEAFKVNAIAYLLKPIEGDELANVIEKFSQEKKDEIGERLASLMKYLSEKEKVKKVALPVMEGLQFVMIDDIVRAEASGNYTTVHLRTGKTLFISKTLKFILETVNSSKFVRVHQSHIINMDYIHKYIRGKNGQIILDDQTVVPVSRSKKDEFLDHF